MTSNPHGKDAENDAKGDVEGEDKIVACIQKGEALATEGAEGGEAAT